MAKYITTSSGTFINIEDIFSIRFDPKGRCFMIEDGKGSWRWLNETDGLMVLQLFTIEMQEKIQGLNKVDRSKLK